MVHRKMSTVVVVESSACCSNHSLEENQRDLDCAFERGCQREPCHLPISLM